MLSFLRKNRGPFVAVDLEGRSARLVQAELVGSQVRILRLAAADLSGDVDMGDPAAVGKCLGKALADMGLKDCPLLMHVSRSQAVLKTISLPAGSDPQDLPGMVRYQVEKELPFRPEEAVIDFTIESHYDPSGVTDNQGLNVLVGAIRMPMVDYYRQIALAAGGRLMRLSLRPYACLRTLQSCGLTRRHRCLALVHVGVEETEIDVLSDDSLAFSRSAPSKTAAGSEPTMGPVLEVIRSLQSYHAVQGSGKIEAVYVSGGTGLEAKIVQELHDRLELPCRLFNPAGAMKLLDDGTCPAFVPALGLAVGQGEVGQTRFDFSNPKRPPAKRDMRKLKRQLAVAAVIVVVAAIAGARVLWIGSMENEVGVLVITKNQLETTNKSVRELAKEADWLKNWPGSDKDWLDHLANLSILFPSCEDVYISNLRTNSDGTMQFNLRAKGDDVVRDLDARLTKGGYVFKRGNESSPTEYFGYNFKSIATLGIKPQVKMDLAATQPTRPGDDASNDPTYNPPKNAPQPGPARPSPTPTPKPTPSPAPTPTKVTDASKPPDDSGGSDSSGSSRRRSGDSRGRQP